MATRFYFEADPASVIAPTMDANWERTITGALVGFRAYHSPTDKRTHSGGRTSLFTYGGTDTADVAAYQWVTESLAFDRTIGGTVSMAIQVRDQNATGAISLAFSLRVIAPNLTVRGNLKQQFSASTVLINSFETRVHDSVALTSVAAKAGDYLVLEVGFHGAAPAVDANLALGYAETGFTDFALTDGVTGNGTPWWELSEDLVLGPASRRRLAPTQRAA